MHTNVSHEPGLNCATYNSRARTLASVYSKVDTWIRLHWMYPPHPNHLPLNYPPMPHLYKKTYFIFLSLICPVLSNWEEDPRLLRRSAALLWTSFSEGQFWKSFQTTHPSKPAGCCTLKSLGCVIRTVPRVGQITDFRNPTFHYKQKNI